MALLLTFQTQHKINVIRAVREIIGLALVQAKEMVEQGALIEEPGSLENFIQAVDLKLGTGICTYTISTYKKPVTPVAMGWISSPV